MSKILIGVVTAAVWFVLSQAASAEQVCKQVCDNGTCVDNPDSTVIIHDHDRSRDRDDRPGVDLRAPGVNIDVGH
jgi:hypothetical protein